MPLHADLLNWLIPSWADDQTAGSVFVLLKLSMKNVTGSIGLSNTFSRLIEKEVIENPKVREKAGGMARSRSVFAYSPDISHSGDPSC
jgi:hypothetical protein